jgi:hypothetical protein
METDVIKQVCRAIPCDRIRSIPHPPPTSNPHPRAFPLMGSWAEGSKSHPNECLETTNGPPSVSSLLMVLRFGPVESKNKGNGTPSYTVADITQESDHDC